MKLLRIALLAASALISVPASMVLANPLGPNVTAGDVTMDGLGSADLTVNQTSNKAIIDWRSFNLDPTETTKFVQPGSDAVVLNRVTGGEGASQILGTLRANGQVFLVNPDGILIGKDATVDVGALVATTHDLFDGDFLNGNYEFGLSGKPDASVVNLGTITVNDSGFAALVAPGVRNAGTITARLGKVSLASTSGFTLDPYGDGLVTLGLSDDTAGEVIDIATGKPLSSLVGNNGLISADGGTVELTAAATRKVVDSVVNNSGTIEADTVGARNGKIVLSASTVSTRPADAPAQKVKVSGRLSASGKKFGEAGGNIEITGEQIALAEATIDAYGWKGGGSVLVGGDKSGGGALPRATTTTVDEGTVIDASATQEGNGGRVVVWSDGDTTFDGTIVARGGSIVGDGGTVETSGKEHLSYSGTVDVAAPKGADGTLLLDPQDVTIGGSGAWTVDPSALQVALMSGNVAVATNPDIAGSGNLTIASNLLWMSDHWLMLAASNNIIIDPGVVIKNVGSSQLLLAAGTSYRSLTDWHATDAGTVIFQGSSIADWSNSSGSVTILYNPTGGYANPTDYAPHVTGAFGSPVFAYMWVDTPSDLQNISTNLDGVYGLANIDLSGVVNFAPIGDLVHPFNGQLVGVSLDGKGSTISHLKVTTANPLAGLFGEIGSSGRITSVHLTNADVKSAASFASAGILAGLNYGFIQDSSAQGRVETTTRDSVTGGLVGWNQGTIGFGQSDSSVYTHGIDPLSPYVLYDGAAGGLVGVNKGGIVASWSRGIVTNLDQTSAAIGGLVGANDVDGWVMNSYSMADVSSPGCVTVCSPPNMVGGFAGIVNYDGPPPYLYQPVGIQLSYSAGHVSGGGPNAEVGGFEGRNIYSAVLPYTYWDVTKSGLSASGDPRAETTAYLTTTMPPGLSNGYPWARSTSINGGYPYLVPDDNVLPISIQTVLAPRAGGGSKVDWTPSDLPPNSSKAGTVSYSPPTPSTKSAAQSFADGILATVVSQFEPFSLVRSQLSDELATLLIVALPKSILDDPRQLGYLQSYMTGQLQAEFNKSLKPGDTGDILIGKGVSIFADVLAAGVGYVLELSYGLNENSWQVIEAEYAVQVAVHASYGAGTHGAVGALAEVANTAVGQVVDSLIKTRDVLSSTEDAFASAEASAQRARELADQLEKTNPNDPQIAKLRSIADQSDAQTAQLRAEVKENWWLRLLSWTL